MGLSMFGSLAVILDVLKRLIGNTLHCSGARIALLLQRSLGLLGHACNVLLRGHTDLVNSRYSSVLSLRDALVGLSPYEHNFAPSGIEHRRVRARMHNVHLLLQVYLTLIVVK